MGADRYAGKSGVYGSNGGVSKARAERRGEISPGFFEMSLIARYFAPWVANRGLRVILTPAGYSRVRSPSREPNNNYGVKSRRLAEDERGFDDALA